MKLVRRHRSQTLAGLIGILLVCGTILGGRVYNQYHGRKHYEAGVRLLEAKDFPHAREELAKAINFGYCSANDPLFHKASLEVELDRQGFISSLTVAISEGKYKEQISSLFRDADQALAERDWEFAADKYYGVLALDPENASALANLAIAKKEQYNALLPDRKVKLLEEGLVLCERALGIDSSRARTWNVKGVLLKMLGKFDEALAAYERARKLNPNDSYYWANIAQVNVLQRNLDLALENLNQGSVSVKPEEKGSCNVLRDLALVEFLRGETQAQTTIERARACDPTEKTLLVRARMRLLSDQPDFQAARDEVGAAERTVKEPHERQYTLRYLALANLRLKRFDHAVESANQAIALGDMPTYNKLILAVAEHHLGHKEKASLVFQEAIDAWPEDLKTEGEFRPSAIKGFLWFESADELFDLRSEIEGLLPPT